VNDLTPFIEQLKDRVPIEAVVQQKVQLQRRGHRYLGLCPFHAEKTPSFNVDAQKGFYKCFGCGVSGDVITFVRETEGRDFLDALRVLADIAGMEMPKDMRGGGRSKAERDLQEAAREALSVARAFHVTALNAPEAEGARAYLRDRGVSQEIAQAFGIGWAPRDRGALVAELSKRQLPFEALESAGLVLRDEDRGGRVKARFWERVMFPVADAGGRTCGFGGRYLPGSFAAEKGLGKYVNSPEGPLFPKRRLLYGMDRLQTGCRDQPDTPIIVCEGNLDVVLLHQAGFLTTVAALGTAMSEEHARFLRRFDRPVVLLMDPDSAGRRAAARAGRLLVQEEVDVRVAELPEGADPADMVQGGEAEELRRRVEKARDILDWRLESWSRKADLSVPAVLDQAATEMAEWIASTPRPVVAEVWARRAQEVLRISEESLRRLVQGPRETAPRPQDAPADSFHPSGTPDPSSILRSNEREIVAAILHDPSALSRFRVAAEALELSDSSAQEVLAWCLERRSAQQLFDLDSCLLAFPDGDTAAWLDSVRRLHIAEPALVLARALEALPANLERAKVTAPGAEPTEEELRSFCRRISISPQEAP